MSLNAYCSSLPQALQFPVVSRQLAFFHSYSPAARRIVKQAMHDSSTHRSLALLAVWSDPATLVFTEVGPSWDDGRQFLADETFLEFYVGGKQ